jgi:hypothetical protein
VHRRLSVATAVVGLVAGIALAVIGPKRDGPGVPTIAAALGDLDARIRETSAGVQARAVTLSQLPRLGWAVATDPGTVRDLTTDELAFKPLPGEVIGMAQLQRKTGTVVPLLKEPADAPLDVATVEPGLRLLTGHQQLLVASVIGIDARERAEEVGGAVVVAQRLEVPAVAERLRHLDEGLRIETSQGATVLGAPTAKTRAVSVPLDAPAARGAKITLLVPVGAGSSGHPFAGALVAVLAALAAAWLWTRGRATKAAAVATAPDIPAERTAPPTLPVPPPPKAPEKAVPRPTLLEPPPPKAPERAAAPPRIPALPPPRISQRVTPPKIPQVALPRPITVPELSIAITDLTDELARVGDPSAALGMITAAGRLAEYHALYREFVALRRTCGEATAGLDQDAFTAVLASKRSELIGRHAYKDVKFRVAFNDGKAVLRAQGTR